MWKTLSDIDNDKYGLKTIFHIFAGFIIYLLSTLVAGIVVDMFYIIGKIDLPVFSLAMRCLLEIVFFIMALYLYVKKGLHLDLAYFRITRKGLNYIWMITAVLLPSVVILFYFVFVKGTVSYGNGEPVSRNIAYALKVGLSAGICEEVLFRGYIMKLVENRWNRKAAILIPSVIFASLHLANGMGSADVLLLFAAGTTVGIMFSMVTYTSGSVLNSVAVHAVWNTLIIGIFKFASQQIEYGSIINYTIESDNIFITGGRFGIESAIPAVIGYITVIVLAFIRKSYIDRHAKPGYIKTLAGEYLKGMKRI
jgi:membrane protease YdiL (CAAX protease family)